MASVFLQKRGIDKMEFVNMQIEDPKYVDVEALKNVIQQSGLEG